MPPRRRPNFVAFIATGAILGFVVGSVIAYFGSGRDTTEYGRSFSDSSAVLFLGVLGACVLGLAAAVLAVLLERRD